MKNVLIIICVMIGFTINLVAQNVINPNISTFNGGTQSIAEIATIMDAVPEDVSRIFVNAINKEHGATIVHNEEELAPYLIVSQQNFDYWKSVYQTYPAKSHTDDRIAVRILLTNIKNNI